MVLDIVYIYSKHTPLWYKIGLHAYLAKQLFPVMPAVRVLNGS